MFGSLFSFIHNEPKDKPFEPFIDYDVVVPVNKAAIDLWVYNVLDKEGNSEVLTVLELSGEEAEDLHEMLGVAIEEFKR